MSKKGPDDEDLEFFDADEVPPKTVKQQRKSRGVELDDDEFQETREELQAPVSTQAKNKPVEKSTSFDDNDNQEPSLINRFVNWVYPTPDFEYFGTGDSKSLDASRIDREPIVEDKPIESASNNTLNALGGAAATALALYSGVGPAYVVGAAIIGGVATRVLASEVNHDGDWRKGDANTIATDLTRAALAGAVGGAAAAIIPVVAPGAGVGAQVFATPAVAAGAEKVLDKPLNNAAGVGGKAFVKAIELFRSKWNSGKDAVANAASELWASKRRISRAFIVGAAVAAVISVSVASAGIVPAAAGVAATIVYFEIDAQVCQLASDCWKSIKSVSQAISNTFSPAKEPVLAKSEDKAVASLKTPPLNDIDKSQAKTIGTEAAVKIAHSSTDSKPLANHQVTTKTTKGHGIVRS